MTRKYVGVIFALIGLFALIGFGATRGFINKIFQSVNDAAQPPAHGQRAAIKDMLVKSGQARRVTDGKVKPIPAELPDGLLWTIVFDFTRKIEAKSIEVNQQGQDGNLFARYFIRQGPLSAENDAILKKNATEYAVAVEPLDQQSKSLIDKVRSTGSQTRDKSQTFLTASETLRKIGAKKREITLQYRDALKASFDTEEFSSFETFLKKDFMKGSVSIKLSGGKTSDQISKTDEFPIDFGLIEAVGASWILADDTQDPPLISGFSELYFTYFGDVAPYDPSLDSYFVDFSSATLLDAGSDTGFEDVFPAYYQHPLFFSNRGEEYCTAADHYADLYDGPFLVDEVYLGSTDDCHIVGPPPTPTPTPPCFTEGCPPTPTPTPTPSPSVTISPIGVVEKYGTKSVSVTITGNDGGTTKLTIKTAANTDGAATFDDGSTEMTINGNVPDQQVKLKGLLQSSTGNNMSIEATVNDNPTVVASQKFTVVLITSLTFEKVDSTYTDLDDNPGTDGVHTTDEGQRIFPDKLSPTDATDRSLVLVKATIAPPISDIPVYFASYDLDDPSSTGQPIDTTGPDGNDNNGPVKSGTFTVPTGNNCSNPVAGTSTAWISTVQCLTTKGGPAIAVFKTTMQPGDNFAIAATVDNLYRDRIKVNPMQGARLINGALQTIHMSGEPHIVDVEGICTNMLTVWRDLHIEVDSMDDVRENYATGTITSAATIANGSSATLNLTTSPLEPNRFESGRVEIGSPAGVLTVSGNTGGFVTVTNRTTNTISCSIGENFNITNAAGTRTVIGTAASSLSLRSEKSGTLAVNSTPLVDSAFQNGTLTLIPTIASVSVDSNTASSINVTNNGASSVTVAANSLFRLYDDDDFNDSDGTNLRGDDGEVLPEPDSSSSSVIADTSTPCGTAPASNCNVLAPAYIVPKYDLSGSHGKTPFILNLPMTTDVLAGPPVPSDVEAAFHFDNVGHEADIDFWTVYISTAYQIDERWDGDPNGTNAILGITDAPLGNAQGSLLFLETSRAREADHWLVGPINRTYTMAHEIGHIFNCQHNDIDSTLGITDAGLMAPSAQLIGGSIVYRTEGTFNAISINKIRGGSWGGVHLTHP